ncbi:uncharacterized protein LOC114288060 [Camellia sinensis]|uniref:uncharacterized protein LOC114288060 n=1 Tax=Camellia sinensis TaxID=4442 RepID=UPI001035BD44|nr:uncharacterized protein LOC114288060 [Camellia sinensis]
MATSNKVSLKLLIDTKANKVLFAEAGKDFVDFLFNLLSLPVGTVIRILTKHSMVGSLGNLYDSIENLNNTYLQPNQNKDSLLKPKASSSICAAQVPLLLADDISPDRKLYMCKTFHLNVADDPKAVCPNCKHYMSTEVPYIAREAVKEVLNGDEGGFVKGVVTYMVMDDLAVKPMSAISSIALLSKFNVKEVGALEERVVHLGMDEISWSDFESYVDFCELVKGLYLNWKLQSLPSIVISVFHHLYI